MSKPALKHSNLQQPLSANMSDGLIDPVSRFMFGLKAQDIKVHYQTFSRLFKLVRKVSFRRNQVNYLFYFVEHPQKCAYDIAPGRKGNESNYRRATLTLEKLHNLGLIETVGSRECENDEKHGAINYSLTDEGILYLIKKSKLPYMMLLQELIKNYCNSNIFRYLLYPHIELETLCSPKMKLNLIAGIGNFLVSIIQKMDYTLELLEKDERSVRERYSWNYEKLEDYLRNKYHLDFLNLPNTEEDFDDDHEEVRYFDNEDDSRDVKIIFDKKSGRGYAYVRNKRVKKHRIPLITDYLNKRIITQEEYMSGYFDAFCSPRAEEFILSIISEYPIDTTDDDIREILSNDEPFIETLKKFKDYFDTVYKRITSYPNFLF